MQTETTARSIGIDDARDDVLEARDHLRSRGDRVDCLVRRGPVAALAADLDREQVGSSRVRPVEDSDLPQLVEREQMRADDEVDTVHHTRLDELARAAGQELLRVLEDEADLADELVAPLLRAR